MSRCSVVGVAVLALAAGACGSEPITEISAALAAVDSARTAEATVYAPEHWMLVDSLETALDVEVTTQGGKFALGRSYAKTKELATSLASAARGAYKEAMHNRGQAQTQASEMLTAVHTAIAELNAELAKAPSSASRRQEVQALKTEVATLEQSVAAADSAFAGSKFADARSAAQDATTRIEALKSRVAALRSPARRG